MWKSLPLPIPCSGPVDIYHVCERARLLVVAIVVLVTLGAVGFDMVKFGTIAQIAGVEV